jgi:hypothetical protein
MRSIPVERDAGAGRVVGVGDQDGARGGRDRGEQRFERKLQTRRRRNRLRDPRAGHFGVEAVHGVGRPQQQHFLAVVHVGVDEDLDGFVGAVGEDELLGRDAEERRDGSAWLRRIRDRRPAGSRRALHCRNSITRGEQPTVFSLKSRRSLPARPAGGRRIGRHGDGTAGRGLNGASGQLGGLGIAGPHLHRARVRFQAFGARQRGDRRAPARASPPRSAAAPKSPSRNPPPTGRRAGAPRRRWAARDWVRRRNRPPLRAERAHEDAARVAIAAAARIRNAQVLRREAVRNLHRFIERPHQHDGAVRAIALRATARSAASQAAARFPSPPPRQPREVVSRMAEASTSCSACASMSAARMARIAFGRDDQISVGPATKSMPTSPASSFFAAAT